MKKLTTSLMFGFCLAGIASAQQIATETAAQQQTVAIPVKGNLSAHVVPGGGGVPTPGALASGAANTATVVLRLFDRQFGGAKLFEERQVVEVKNGIFVAFVGNGTRGGVSKSITDAHPTVYAEWSLANSAGVVMEPRATILHTRQASSTPTGSVYIPTDVSLCYTCGGSYPIFSGSFTNGGSYATERYSSCSLTLASRLDSSPFICSR